MDYPSTAAHGTAVPFLPAAAAWYLTDVRRSAGGIRGVRRDGSGVCGEGRAAEAATNFTIITRGPPRIHDDGEEQDCFQCPLEHCGLL